MAATKRDKRESGAGSITQRKDGLWTARIMVGYLPNGRPHIKALYGHSQAEVKRKLKALKDELAKNDYNVVKRESVQNYMTRWLQDNKKNILKPTSYDRLEQTLNFQVFPEIGEIQIATIKAADVQHMVNTLAEKGLSYSTIKKAYDAVNDCFSTGVIQRSVNFNPALGVTLPRRDSFGQKQEIRFYHDDEVEKICAASIKRYGNGKRIYRLGSTIILDINTGMRLAELTALRWENVDFEKKEITIDSTIVMAKDRSGGEQKFVPLMQESTKSKAGMRHIPLNDSALEALRDLHDITGDTPFVCASKNGTAELPRFIDRTFRNILKTAGFPEDRIFGIHSLRHTFATRLLRSGADIKTVSTILGHSDITVTYNTYIHVIEEEQRKAVSGAKT